MQSLARRRIARRARYVMVAALAVLAAGPAFATGEEEAAAATGDGPQYGGTLTAFRTDLEPVQADQTSTVGRAPALVFSGPIMDYLMMTDYEGCGPRGSGVFPSTYPGIYLTPEQCWTGALAERWEAHEDRIVFHLRQGVTWQGNDVIGFEPRELVADDVVFALTRAWNSRPTAWTWDGGAIDNIVAEDRYTVVVELSRFDLEWIVWTAANPNAIYAPEVVEAGAGEWEHQAGTGPFRFAEYVEGSFMRYERHDDYWGSPTIIDGVEYETPFVDEMIYLIIKDLSTRVAALRTGNLDLYYWMPVKQEQSLAETAPELEKFRYLSSGTHALGLRSDIEPFDNKRVRHAVSMALDAKQIADTVLLEAQTEGIFPMIEGYPGHIPPAELSPEIRAVYEYHPERAKEILAEEGYPNGFEVTTIVRAADTNSVAILELVKSYWEEVGVDLEINALEQLAYQTERRARNYHVVRSTLQNQREVGAFNKHSINFAGGWNDAIWTDPAYYDPLFVETSATLDLEERNRKWAQLARIVVEETAYVPLGIQYELSYWWPWVKNYYGESSTTFRSSSMVEAGIWIDQALKQEMGY